MFAGLAKSLFGSSNERYIQSIRKIVDKINDFEPTMQAYDDAALRRLSFIRHARQLGFDLDAIRSLLDLSDHPDRPCGEANAIAEHHLSDVAEKIAQLQALQTELARMSAECAGGRVSACKVIEALHERSASL